MSTSRPSTPKKSSSSSTIKDTATLLTASADTKTASDNKTLVNPMLNRTHDLANTFSYSQLTLGREIQSGNTARIREAIFNGEKVALKEYKDKNWRSYLEREASFHLLCDSPYIVKILGVCFNPPAMLFEWMPSDLFDAKKLKKLSFHQKIQILFDVCIALEHLQQLQISHRDIMVENILLDTDNRAKLCDFGLVCHFNENFKYGSDSNKATELFSNTPIQHPEKLDVYSFGIMMVNLFYEVSIFQNFEDGYVRADKLNGNFYEIVKAVARGIKQRSSEIPEEYMTFATRCFDDNPQQRPTVGEIKTFLSDLLKTTNDAKAVVTDVHAPTRCVAPQPTEDAYCWAQEDFSSSFYRNLQFSVSKMSPQDIVAYYAFSNEETQIQAVDYFLDVQRSYYSDEELNCAAQVLHKIKSELLNSPAITSKIPTQTGAVVSDDIVDIPATMSDREVIREGCLHYRDLKISRSLGFFREYDMRKLKKTGCDQIFMSSTDVGEEKARAQARSLIAGYLGYTN